ncbi:SEC14-like protein [Trichinella spiralis]|uniref:SEC14-like protein n=1 Tax=Trichinella spiralis TaxID=6334 RepID=A0ABR3K2C8_TRISP
MRRPSQSGEDHPAVSKWTSVECECCDDTNVEDGYTKTRPRERRRAGQDEVALVNWIYGSIMTSQAIHFLNFNRPWSNLHKFKSLFAVEM